MVMDADLASLQALLSGSDLKQVDDAGIAKLRDEFPELPPDYFSLLRHCGFGGLLRSRFMLYSGPIDPGEVFGPGDPICQAPMVLVGDDFSGGHLGYLKTGRGWRLCSFDQMSTVDIVPEDDTSIVRYFLARFRDPED
jgi:hypothetical protein